LLLDEPLSNLDPELVASMLDLVRQVRMQTDVTLVYVSHDASTVATLCEEVAVMRRGRIVQAGTWEEVEPTAVVRSVPADGEYVALEIRR
jgi:ABC-type glutathione transport system ATPase component